MKEEQVNALREWVLAEIEYDRARNEEGADGYTTSAIRERDYAESCFLILKSLMLEQPLPKGLNHEDNP